MTREKHYYINLHVKLDNMVFSIAKRMVQLSLIISRTSLGADITDPLYNAWWMQGAEIHSAYNMHLWKWSINL